MYFFFFFFFQAEDGIRDFHVTGVQTCALPISRLFADPDFDGEPALITEEEMNEKGEVIKEVETVTDKEAQEIIKEEAGVEISETPPVKPPRKFYVDNGSVEIAAHL